MIQLTYWEDPTKKNTEEDFDEILTIRLKSVEQIKELIAAKPLRCTMISIERSAPVLTRDKSRLSNPSNPKHYKELWRKGSSTVIPKYSKFRRCPLCDNILGELNK